MKTKIAFLFGFIAKVVISIIVKYIVVVIMTIFKVITILSQNYQILIIYYFIAHFNTSFLVVYLTYAVGNCNFAENIAFVIVVNAVIVVEL